MCDTVLQEDVGFDFSTDDIDLLLATYMSHKTDGESMGTFLAKTNLPELCVQEFRTHVTNNDIYQVHSLCLLHACTVL